MCTGFVRAGQQKAPERSHSAFRGVDTNSRGTTRFSCHCSPQPPIRLWQITLPYGFGYYRFTGTAPGPVYTAPSPSACTNRRLSEDDLGLSSPHLSFSMGNPNTVQGNCQDFFSRLRSIKDSEFAVNPGENTQLNTSEISILRKCIIWTKIFVQNGPWWTY